MFAYLSRREKTGELLAGVFLRAITKYKPSYDLGDYVELLMHQKKGITDGNEA